MLLTSVGKSSQTIRKTSRLMHCRQSLKDEDIVESLWRHKVSTLSCNVYYIK
jgi:hypothetical protein